MFTFVSGHFRTFPKIAGSAVIVATIYLWSFGFPPAAYWDEDAWPYAIVWLLLLLVALQAAALQILLPVRSPRKRIDADLAIPANSGAQVSGRHTR